MLFALLFEVLSMCDVLLGVKLVCCRKFCWLVLVLGIYVCRVVVLCLCEVLV